MIRPQKYMSLPQCPLAIAAAIAHELWCSTVLPLSEAYDRVSVQHGPDALANVQEALNVLFLLGVVDYDEDSDTLLLNIADD